MQEVKSALRFAGTFEELQGQLVALLWQLVMKPAVPIKTCAAILAAALVPCFPPAQVRLISNLTVCRAPGTADRAV